MLLVHRSLVLLATPRAPECRTWCPLLVDRRPDDPDLGLPGAVGLQLLLSGGGPPPRRLRAWEGNQAGPTSWSQALPAIRSLFSHLLTGQERTRACDEDHG